MSNIRDIAERCEARMIAYRKSKDGEAVTFVMHPNEVPKGIREAHVGARFILAMIEIGDDELPVDRKADDAAERSVQTKPDTPPASASVPERARRRFDELSPAQQAGILCNEKAFQKFLRAQLGWPVLDEPSAADAVRKICGVASRSDLNQPATSRDEWRNLVAEYRAWQREPEYVPHE